MTKWKIRLSLTLAIAGTAAMVLYAALVLPGAPSNFQVAVLFFTAVAAIVGFLGLLVSFLTYRMEAGRVPKPDLRIRDAEGDWTQRLRLEAAFIEPTEAFDQEVEARRSELDALRTAGRASALGGFVQVNYESDVARYKKDVEQYLKEFEEHLKFKSLWECFWRRSFVTVLGVTNDKAGVPASGIQLSVHFPEEGDGIRILPLSQLPPPPKEPEPPAPPRPGSFLGLNIDPARFMPPTPRFDMPDLTPPGNVSGPEIGRGSVKVTYQVQELLHNTLETTEDDPIVISFLYPGQWTVPFEIHARNLPTPKKGSLSIEVAENQDAPSYEPPAEDSDDSEE